MVSYIIGKITSLNKKSITVESNWTGYVINVTNPELFELGKVRKIYLHKHTSLTNKNSVNEEYYGFVNYDQKEMFLKLLSLNGIGPKTAIQILKNDLSLIKNMILSKDVKGLSACQSINEKVARQMIDNIEISSKEGLKTNPKISELISALESLGYQKNEIEDVISNKEIIGDTSIDLSDLVSNAIKYIAIKADGISKTA